MLLLPQNQAPRPEGAASRGVGDARVAFRRSGVYALPRSAPAWDRNREFATMLSRLKTGLWQMIRDGFTGSDGRYWLA